MLNWRRIKLSAVVVLSLCLTILATTSHCPLRAEEALRVGFAKVDITPSQPTPMAGYYHGRLSTETHDPLWCRAVVIDDGANKAAIITLDLISTTRWMTVESRKMIERVSGIPAANVMISATHTHTGPSLHEPNSTRYMEMIQVPSTELYMTQLPGKIADCVNAALSNLQATHPHYAIGVEEKLTFNRRFFMEDGTVGWNPGKLNAKIVREAGPTDDTLPLVAWMDDKQQPQGVMLNYCIHLDTVGGTQWSADMPHTLIESLESVFGNDKHIQYATACCGDLNHIDVRSASPQKGHGEAARIGVRLAGAALRALPNFVAAKGSKLHVTSQTVPLNVFEHSPERVAWAESIAEKSKQQPQPSFWDMVEAFRILDNQFRKNKPYDVEVQVISVGRDVAWVALSGEVFVQLGMDIKAGSPFRLTAIHELANGSIGYIPTREAYGQGNYEVISARCAKGSGELLVQSAIAQLREHFSIQASKE